MVKRMANLDLIIESLRERLKSSSLYPALKQCVRAGRKLYRSHSFNAYHRDIRALEKRLLFRPEFKVLNLGCGSKRYPRNVCNMDIIMTPAVQLIGDAHKMPFVDSVFDVVWANAVLEHLNTPPVAKAEIKRIIKEGGYLYLEIPFFQCVHAAPDDYQRYTKSGLAKLFGDFEEMQISVVSGPASAFSHTLRHFLAVLLSFNTKFMYNFFYGCVFSYLTFWIKYLDFFLIDNVNADILCFGYGLLCRKGRGGGSA